MMGGNDTSRHGNYVSTSKRTLQKKTLLELRESFPQTSTQLHSNFDTTSLEL